MAHRVCPERSTWFPRKPITIPALHQNIHHTKEAHQEKIISWKYDELKRLFVIKRRGGVIQYFTGQTDLKSLPRWDIRELNRAPFINHTNNSTGTMLARLIEKECDNEFQVFKPQKPR